MKKDMWALPGSLSLPGRACPFLFKDILIVSGNSNRLFNRKQIGGPLTWDYMI